MIQLTLSPDTDPKTLTFDQREVIIGSDSSKTAHFTIADASIQDEHVKIFFENGCFILRNAANDPFTSLNGVPFGKKILKTRDRIQIREHIIQFSTSDGESKKSSSMTGENEQERRLNPSEKLEREDKRDVILKIPALCVQKQESAVDIEALLKEVEQLGENKKEILREKTQESGQIDKMSSPDVPKESPIELGDSPPLSDCEDTMRVQKQESPSEKENPSSENAEQKENWKMLMGLFLAIITFCLIVCSSVYFRASGKHSQEEKKIAAGISDIAMAMTQALTNHIVPSQQNWSDPDFIQTNLNAVLSPNLHSQAQTDSQGHFLRNPYILRVYTSGDFTRFIVLAQPAPNFFQWLIHKKTIVIDSTVMEMRKIHDLKKLNQLLANPSPFEGKNGKEISRVIQEGTLMPLASLSGQKNHWGFTPPKELAFLRPGAENYIYNAPRYYPFGETLLRDAISLMQGEKTSSDVASLQEEIEEFEKFQDIVLYTSQGLKNAMEAQKALLTFAPKSHFVVGYVKFSQNGFLARSEIFIKDESNEISFMQPGMLPADTLLDQSSQFRETAQLIDSEKAMPQEPEMDSNHPLYLRLLAIATSRTDALQPISEEIIRLLQRQNAEIDVSFDEKMQNLLDKYRKKDNNHRSEIVLELAILYKEYSEMPFEKFLAFIEASKLTSFFNEALQSKQKKRNDNETKEAIEKHLLVIDQSDSLTELDENLQKVTHLLNLDDLSDPSCLVTFQEKLHNRVLDKLHQLLLVSANVVSTNTVEQDRTTLIRILKAAWVVEKEEFDYFLKEFDNRF